MVAKKLTEAKLEGKVVRLIWDSSDGLPTLYSNHLIVTHGGESEFHIIFGHLTPPLILAASEDELPDHLVIKPVAKIVVTPQTMKKFIDAMAKNLKGFEEKQKED